MVFAVFFAQIRVWPLIDDQPVRLWAFGVKITLVLVSFTFPQILAPLFHLRFFFGLLLDKIVSPLIMDLLFYITVTPIGLIKRALGKRPLALKFDPQAESYWTDREPPGPEPET